MVWFPCSQFNKLNWVFSPMREVLSVRCLGLPCTHCYVWCRWLWSHSAYSLCTWGSLRLTFKWSCRVFRSVSTIYNRCFARAVTGFTRSLVKRVAERGCFCCLIVVSWLVSFIVGSCRVVCIRVTVYNRRLNATTVVWHELLIIKIPLKRS